MSTLLKTTGDAIRSRYKTLVGDAQDIDVHYENSPKKLPADGEKKWIRTIILWDDQHQVETGAVPRWRQEGILVSEIRVPLGEGDSAARVLADVVVTAFRGVSFNSITFRSPQPRRVGRVGNWWQFNVSCPFYIDELE